MIKFHNLMRKTNNPSIIAFLEEIKDVCKKHGYSISHEDHHGSFVILKYSEEDANWLLYARDET